MYKILTSSFPNNFLHHCLHFQKLFVAKRKNDEKTSSSRGFIGSRHEWKHDNLRGPLVTTLLLLLSAAWGLFWALLHLKSRIIRYVSFYYLQKSLIKLSDCLPHHSIFQSSRLFFFQSFPSGGYHILDLNFCCSLRGQNEHSTLALDPFSFWARRWKGTTRATNIFITNY